MDYYFDQIFAVDPSNVSNVARDADVLLYAPGDLTKAPVALRKTDGADLPNPVHTNDNGFAVAFIADVGTLAWDGGGFSGFFHSPSGYATAAQTSAADAYLSRVAAEDAVTLATAPTAEAVNTVLLDPATASSVKIAADIAQAVADGTAPLALKPDNGGKPVGKGELVINAADYIKADGFTNDAAGLAAAAEAAALAKVPLFLPASATIVLGSLVELPDGLTMHTNGSTFKCNTNTANFLIAVGSNTTISGGLKLVLGSGVTNVRGVFISAKENITVDTVSVVGFAPGVGVGDSYDQALAVNNSTDIRIGKVVVKNFDFPVKFDGCARVVVDSVDIETYQRGVYINDTAFLTLNHGSIRVASPNASASPGHNGILIGATAHDATNNLHFTNVTVQDAAEHGIRIGGSFKVSKVWFTDCATLNTGGCGFKVLGGTVTDNNYHEDIFFTSCLAEDLGQDNSASSGFMLQFVKNVQVINPIVRKKNKAFSAGSGVTIQAAQNLIVANPQLSDTIEFCYGVGFVLGNSTNVKLVGGILSTTTGDGIKLDYTNRTFRRVSIEGQPQVDVSGAGYGLNVVAGGTASVIGGSWISWQSSQTATRQIAPASVLGDYFCDVLAPYSGDPTFKNGSRWTDSATGVIRYKNATWKTLA